MCTLFFGVCVSQELEVNIFKQKTHKQQTGEIEKSKNSPVQRHHTERTHLMVKKNTDK